jgi:hypothetical protein
MTQHIYQPAKVWSYPNYDPDDEQTLTITEKGILDEYYTYWSGKMIKNCGEAFFEEHYSFADCIYDWIIVHWAWAEPQRFPIEELPIAKMVKCGDLLPPDDHPAMVVCKKK